LQVALQLAKVIYVFVDQPFSQKYRKGRRKAITKVTVRPIVDKMSKRLDKGNKKRGRWFLKY
jgi:hypothetical protein